MILNFNECLDYINNKLYNSERLSNIKSKYNMNIIIKHLSIKNIDRLRTVLNDVIKQSENGSLLVHEGLLNILVKEFPTELLDLSKTERARRFLEE